MVSQFFISRPRFAFVISIIIVLAGLISLQQLPIEWHMIGHLQRNKVRRSLPHLSCVQSVDSVRLLDTLQPEALRIDRQVRVLLEVNVSRDVEKTGLLAEDLLPLTQRMDQWDRLDISGLMAMSGRLG